MIQIPSGTVMQLPAAPPVTTRSLSQLAFWRRFTPAEREDLQGSIAGGAQGKKNKLNAFRDNGRTGKVELDDGYIISIVTLMETEGVLAAGRASTILTTPVAPSEV